MRLQFKQFRTRESRSSAVAGGKTGSEAEGNRTAGVARRGGACCYVVLLYIEIAVVGAFIVHREVEW